MDECRGCNAAGPLRFTKTSARRHLCRECFNKRRRAYRGTTMLRAIMSRIHSRGDGGSFRIADGKAVLKMYGHKSVWGGSPDDLTIVRIDRAAPLTVHNAMVVTVRQANRAFPESVLQDARDTVAPILD